MPHIHGRKFAVLAAPCCRGLVENFRESSAGLGGPWPFAHFERVAFLIAQREARITGAPIDRDEGGGRHGMYMPPFTWIMFPVM